MRKRIVIWLMALVLITGCSSLEPVSDADLNMSQDTFGATGG